jgi:uncharacterized protein YjiS (DUF1127 family)
MLNHLGNGLRALTAAVTDWRERRQAYSELAALDDRSLADIGITRSEIPFMLTHPSAREVDASPSATDSDFRHAA